MALPKNYNRHIVVDGETYIWYLKRNEAWKNAKHIAVHHEGEGSGQFLLLDFSAHDFEIRPGMIAEAIAFALTSGWTPKQKAKPLYIGFDNVDFVVLPRGEQYLRVFPHPPSITWLTPEETDDLRTTDRRH
jgi:hypothetical protein